MPTRVDQNRTYATRKLKQARKAAELTQTEIAELIKVKYGVSMSQAVYQKVENQEQSIVDEKQIAAIARILRYPISELFEVRTVS